MPETRWPGVIRWVAAAHATLACYQAGDGGAYLVRVNSSADCDEGWRFINAPTQIEICTTTCDLVRNDPGAELTILFGCIGPPPPVV